MTALSHHNVTDYIQLNLYISLNLTGGDIRDDIQLK